MSVVPSGIVRPIRPAELTGLRRVVVEPLDVVAQRREVGLERVVHAPEAPHARVVVLGDVAVLEQVADRLVDAAGAALDLERVGLARADRLGVQALGARLLLRVSC